MLTMGVSFVVSIFVARHLGPGDFGILSYAISLASLFAIATHLGLQGLAVRELVKYPDLQDKIMGTISGLKFLIAIIATIGFLIFIWFTGETSEMEFWVLLIVSGTVLLKPFEIFDFWFQAKVKAKYSSKVRGGATIIIAVLKILLVFLGAKVLAFAYAYLLHSLLIAIFFIVVFVRQTNQPFKKWKFKFSMAKELLGQGWMIMLGTIFSMVYLKIDQVMIRWMINVEEVGIYSVSVKLSEAWYFIPSVIVASLFPKLIELHEENKEDFNKILQKLLDLLFIIAFVLAIVITFLSDALITSLYGLEYQRAAVILSIHIWAGIFIFMRAAFSKWILIEDAITFSMITHGFGAFVNIILNIFLVPEYGGIGAAIATLLSYAMASYISLFFYKASRPIFWMMTKSLLAPFRYSFKVMNKK